MGGGKLRAKTRCRDASLWRAIQPNHQSRRFITSAPAIPVSADLRPQRIPLDRWEWRVIFALLGSTLLKIVWAASSAGTADPIFFFMFAGSARTTGLIRLYNDCELFNHTPLTGGFIVVLHWMSGGDRLMFAFLLRLASIVADAVLVAALLFVRRKTGKPPWWALMLFAASPVSIMVSGFHGNVDPIMVLFLFLAAVACLGESAVLCGLLFGLACNVKVVPILFGPVFLFYWLARGKAWRFAAASGALIVLGSAWPLLQCPAVYLHHVFGYSSSWGVWGISYWLMESGARDFQTVNLQSWTHAEVLVAQALKVIIVTGICVFGWRRRRVDGAGIFSTMALAWLVFFVFAPGIGVQYMVWGAPFILMLSPRWSVAVTAAASLFLAVFYQAESTDHHFPWFLVFPKGVETPLWSAWGNVAWITFAMLLVWAVWQYWSGALNEKYSTPAEDS
jgi:hypothetical protein